MLKEDGGVSKTINNHKPSKVMLERSWQWRRRGGGGEALAVSPTELKRIASAQGNSGIVVQMGLSTYIHFYFCALKLSNPCFFLGKSSPSKGAEPLHFDPII